MAVEPRHRLALELRQVALHLEAELGLQVAEVPIAFGNRAEQVGVELDPGRGVDRIHAEAPHYAAHAFRPWRLVALAFKALRTLAPGYELWRDFRYEYDTRLAIDVISGGTLLRQWVDDPAATPGDLDAAARADEDAWREEREAVLLY